MTNFVVCNSQDVFCLVWLLGFVGWLVGFVCVCGLESHCQPARSLVALFLQYWVTFCHLPTCGFVFQFHSGSLGESHDSDNFLASNLSVWSDMSVYLFQVELTSLDLALLWATCSSVFLSFILNMYWKV